MDFDVFSSTKWYTIENTNTFNANTTTGCTHVGCTKSVWSEMVKMEMDWDNALRIGNQWIEWSGYFGDGSMACAQPMVLMKEEDGDGRRDDLRCG